jgi:phosphomannomutase
MSTDASIFKAYDIRGIVGRQMDKETSYRVGRAFGQLLKRENQGKTLQVVVGRDMRSTGVEFQVEMMRGLNEEGISVLDIGMVSTPMMYFAVVEYGANGGVVITASHNPAEYNGFKLVRNLAIPVAGDTGIYEIRDKVVNGTLEEVVANEVTNQIIDDLMSRYIEQSLSYRDHNIVIKPLKVVVDTANGMAGPVMKELFKHFPEMEVIHLFEELDGNFPNHEANPLKEETLIALKEKVKSEGADLGIACDGDFDRISFVDEEGRTVRPDITTALLAPIVLEGNDGATILYDLRSSNITPEKIIEAGGVAKQTRVGHSFIKAQMRAEKALFSGEFSGHFYVDVPHKGEHAYFENPLFVTIKMLELLSSTDLSLTDLTKPLFRYYHSGEINFEVSRPKEEILDEVKATLSEGELTEIDGIRIDYPDFWVSVRGSNTEPVVRLVVEAKTSEKMNEVVSKMKLIITK